MTNNQVHSDAKDFWQHTERKIWHWKTNPNNKVLAHNIYYNLTNLHPSLGCITKVCRLDETIEFLVFTTSKKPEAIEAIKILAKEAKILLERRKIVDWYIHETNAKDLDGDLNNWQAYKSRWWEEGSLRKTEIQKLVEQSEYSFIARTCLADVDFTPKTGLDEGRPSKCVLRLSHFGSTSEPWFTPLDVEYIRNYYG